MKWIIDIYKSEPGFWKRLMFYNIVMVISTYFFALGLSDLLCQIKTKKEFDYAKENNPKAYVELYETYDEYIMKIADVINACGNRDILFVYSLYLNMLDNGYFSYGNYIHKTEPKVEFFDNEGINVVYGGAVCRNRANHLNDVLNALGYESSVSYGEYYIESPEHDVNHAVVYVKVNGIDYLLDPMNQSIYLRDSLGNYLHCEDKLKGFIPNYLYDYAALDRLNDNSLYFSTDNQYAERNIVIQEYNEYCEVVQEYHEYLKEYEEENLLSLEEEIKKTLDYCYENGLNVN